MVLLPGCSCCAGAVPCEACQSWCGYQITADREKTTGDISAIGVQCNILESQVENPDLFSCLSDIAGPVPCNSLQTAAYYSDAEVEGDGGWINYVAISLGTPMFGAAASFFPGGSAQYFSDYRPGGADLGIYDDRWIVDRYSWEGPGTVGDGPFPQIERRVGANPFWYISCEDREVGGVTTKCVALKASLTKSVTIQTSDYGILEGTYDPPYIYDGNVDEFPAVSKTQTKLLDVILATACQSPDQQTEECNDSSDPVVGWRPGFFTVKIAEDGVTLTTASEVTQYQWDSDTEQVVYEGWYEFQQNASGNYEATYKRAAGDESYFEYVPFSPVTWEANFLSTSGSVEVSFDDWCGLSTPAGENTTEVPEGIPLPLGEEQAAYVHGYATEQTADTTCTLASYPSWSVHWKNKHLLITDLSVARCGDIPVLTTFTVWLYFDGLINNQLEGNEINGVPVNGFVMAVRSWNVTVRLGHPPVITQDTSTSPCNAEGEMPFCDDLVPEFEITYGEA